MGGVSFVLFCFRTGHGFNSGGHEVLSFDSDTIRNSVSLHLTYPSHLLYLKRYTMYEGGLIVREVSFQEDLSDRDLLRYNVVCRPKG